MCCPGSVQPRLHLQVRHAHPGERARRQAALAAGRRHSGATLRRHWHGEPPPPLPPVRPPPNKQVDTNSAEIHVTTARAFPSWVSGYCTKWPILSRFQSSSLCSLNVEIKKLSTFPWHLTLSLPRVIKFKFPLLPHQKYNTTQYEELGFSSLTLMTNDYTANSHYTTHTSLYKKVGRMYFLILGVKGLTDWFVQRICCNLNCAKGNLELKLYPNFHWVVWLWRRTLSNGSDDKCKFFYGLKSWCNRYIRIRIAMSDVEQRRLGFVLCSLCPWARPLTLNDSRDVVGIGWQSYDFSCRHPGYLSHIYATNNYG